MPVVLRFAICIPVSTPLSITNASKKKSNQNSSTDGKASTSLGIVDYSNRRTLALLESTTWTEQSYTNSLLRSRYASFFVPCIRPCRKCRVACISGAFVALPYIGPPIEVDYLDTDPLEYAVRTEARKWGFDDFQYMRELAFVRIHNNPSVGQFRQMSPAQRRDIFWGSDRQDFFRHLTFSLTGTPEHLYHRGW